MAKTNEDDRVIFNEKITSYREAIEAILKEEQEARKIINQKNPESAVKRLELADTMINLASNYLVINGISQSMQYLKNEIALNDARKALYKSITYLEEVVSKFVDAPLSDYEDLLDLIESISPAKRFYIVRKLGFAIQLLEDAYGSNTKWRWAFVELEGRFAAVAKNLIDLRDVMANSDPRSPHYEPTVLHLRLVRKLLMQAANRYREMYELSTSRVEDFKTGISFLSALRRLNILTNKQLDAATDKKKLEVWNNKLTADMAKLEAASGKG